MEPFSPDSFRIWASDGVVDDVQNPVENWIVGEQLFSGGLIVLVSGVCWVWGGRSWTRGCGFPEIRFGPEPGIRLLEQGLSWG